MINVRKLTGQVIGNYQLRELYGAGGMGAVYRAYQINLERDVAFKIMNMQYTDDPEFVKRFQREAKLAASLEHPGIVPIHDYGAFDGILFVVMRLLTGGSLQERMHQRQGKRPSPGEVSVILKQLASALDYAHSKGIVHRDVKAGNVMFDNHGTAYLVDFGIARLLQDTGTRITADGMTVGTPTHMAPEQWLGENPTPAADQYALAVLVYELLTGRLPFTAPTPYALMSQHLNQAPPPPRQLVPALPDGLTAVIGRALAKDKLRRYPTATAFAQAFEEAVAPNPGKATQMFSFELRRDLLHTDVLPETPQPEQHTAQLSPQASAATIPFSEQEILQSAGNAVPASPRTRQPVPQPVKRAPVPNRAAQRNATSAIPYPQSAPVSAQPQPRQRALQPLQPAPQVVIVEREKEKNDESNPGGGILFGFLKVIRRIFGLLLSTVGFILKQMLKSTIAFIVTLLLSALVIFFLASFGVSMFQNDMDIARALGQMGAFIRDVFGSGGGWNIE